MPPSAIRAAVESDIALLRRLRPKAILLDWRPSMRLAAAIVGIPVVAVVNAHVTRNYLGPLAAPERHLITRVFGRRVADRLMPRLAPLFFRHWARPYEFSARRHGHPGWPDFRDYLVGDAATLYADLPSLAPTRPGSGIYVGPLVDDTLPAPPLPALREPVLYVTFGSMPMTRYTASLRAVVGDWSGSVVVSSGGQEGIWPSGWVALSYVRPNALYQQGVRVAWLYHGGNGSSYQLVRAWTDHPALSAGAVAVPFHAEQQWNALKLASLGAVSAIGSLHHLDPTVERALQQLRDAVLQPPDPSFAEEVRRYAHAEQRAAAALRSVA